MTTTEEPGTVAAPAGTAPAAVGDTAAAAPSAEQPSGVGRWWAWLRSVDRILWAPVILALLNGVVFVLVRPDVNDLWAARARASAVRHGVGLTYWFSWFGGGSTPGNYSVVAPYLSAYLGTEVVGALAALAVTVLAAVVLRGTRHPLAATWLAAFGAGANLWSGRVPFLLGAAVGMGALLAVRNRRRALTVALTLGSILASPVAGAFVALGLSGTFLTTRTKDWRPIIGWAAGTVAIGLVLVALAFGTPGPEPFSVGLALELLGALVLLYLARPPDHLRTTIFVTAMTTVVLWAVPNGMGSNLARFVWFCLPVAVVALSRRPVRDAVLLVIPLLAVGASSTVSDLANATRPVSSVDYYQPLTQRLDAIPALRDYRLEVVDHGAHAGYAALLGHALLARGWETQADLDLNAPLNESPLPALTYKLWLDNNAVGYVALPSTSVGQYPEYDLVHDRLPSYLHEVWSNSVWRLYRVADPTPIVGAPARLLGYTESTMTLQIPCTCTVQVRVRWSKFLVATLKPAANAGTSSAASGSTAASGPAAGGSAASGSAAGGSAAASGSAATSSTATSSTASASAAPEVSAMVRDDGTGWTTITTEQRGTYVLSGSLGGIVR